MNLDPRSHHRRSIQLKEYDYGQRGAYFVTIVTRGRECLFGEIVDGEMKFSHFGQIARREWLKTAELRRTVKLWGDEFAVMPNHVHGIIWINENDDVGARRRRASTTEQFGKPVIGSLATIVRAYKSAVTYAIHELRGTRGAPIWQRNYYEHVIRNETEHERIYNCIQFNPLQWAKDEENPAQ
jgi:putative transposase